jgi:hypothetical protein
MSKASWLRFLVVALALFGVSTGNWWTATTARAADLEKLDTSLKLIPADAAFYSTSLRGREQLEMFLNSNAFAKLKALPVTQMGLQMFQMQAANPQSEASRALVVLKNPEVKKLVDLVADMFSNEVFLYGDESCVDFLGLMMELNSAQRYEPLMLKIQGQDKGQGRRSQQAQAVLSTIVENIEIVAVPNMLMGFKLDKPAAANEALVKLEMFANIALSQAPPQFQGIMKRETIAGHEYLVLRLNGKLIPWKGNEAEELQRTMGIEEEDAEEIIDHVKGMDLVIALGMRENYLLASMGSSATCIEKLGDGEKLMNLPQFKPLANFTDRKLTGISYASAEINQIASFQAKDIDQLCAVLEQQLSQTDLGEEKTKQIMDDARTLADDIKSLVPEAGAEMALSFLSEQGVESYDYKWGDQPQLDGSKPLDLLEHVGGNPLFGIVGRAKTNPKDYDMLTKWLSTGWKYFNEFALPAMDEPEREKVAVYIKDLMPLVERLDKATRESLIPALADGQSALVFDGKFESKQFVNQLPAWEKAMPLPELALVIGVSDANLLKKGVKEYLTIAVDTLEVVRKNDPQVFEEFKKNSKSPQFPDGFKLPEMAVTEGSGYSIYGVTIPSEIGLDKNFVPNAGLSDHVAVLSLSTKHSERLLQKTPFTAGGVLAKTDRPLATAIWFNWAGLLDTAKPWIDFGLDQVDESQLGGDRATVVEQVHVFLDVLKCIRCLTLESHLEDGCLVTHSLTEIHDVNK